jgi:Arc/MetJ-type ribon-helix-helix transcriptional regulator
MARVALQVPVSKEVHDWLESQAEAEGYDTSAQFVRAMILKQRREEEFRQRVNAALLEALADDDVAPLTPDDFEAIKREGQKRLRKAKQS